MKRIDLDRDDLRQRYLEGVSEKALAESYGVDRKVIRRHLLELGIEPRDRSAAMRERMRQTAPEERARLASAAHDAVRGMTRSEADLARRARGRERTAYFVSPYEKTLALWLKRRGVFADPQRAVGRYNLDLSVMEAVAVELHRTSANPAHHRATRERAHYLLDRGWSVIYVWCSYSRPLSAAAADEIVAFTEEVERLPSGARQYRVIRGTGEHVTSARFNANEAANVPAPKTNARP